MTGTEVSDRVSETGWVELMGRVGGMGMAERGLQGTLLSKLHEREKVYRCTAGSHMIPLGCNRTVWSSRMLVRLLRVGQSCVRGKNSEGGERRRRVEVRGVGMPGRNMLCDGTLRDSLKRSGQYCS